MTDPIREQILTAIHSKLANIQTVNGYNTDMGKEAFRSFLPPLDIDILPCVGFMPGTEENLTEKGLERSLPIEIQGISEFGTLKTYEVAELLYADIVECVLGVQWSLGFDSGGTYQITIGSTITGADSGAEAYVCGIEIDSGAWADSDAAGILTLRRKNDYDFEDDEQIDIESESDVANVDGLQSGQSAIVSTTNSLANTLMLLTDGMQYPAEGQSTVGVNVRFGVTYRTINGNPYLQPS